MQEILSTEVKFLEAWEAESEIVESLPSLTEREWAIMNIFWNKKDLSVQDVIDELALKEKKHYQTVKKQIEILVKKGFLTKTKKSPLWLYSPKFGKRAVVFKEVTHFIESIAGSSLSETYLDMIEKRTFHPVELKNIMEKILNLMLAQFKEYEEK